MCKHYLRENFCSCRCQALQIVDHNLDPSGFSSLHVVVEGDTKRTGIGLYINVWVLLLESYWTQGAMHRLAADFMRHAWNAREAH